MAARRRRFHPAQSRFSITGAERVKKFLARDRGLEALEKVLCRGEINPALLDQLGAGFVSESVPHHVADLLLVKDSCCAQADRAKTNAIARMRKVSVLENLIATSRGSRGLREIQILLQWRGIAIFTTEAGRRCQVSGSGEKAKG